MKSTIGPLLTIGLMLSCGVVDNDEKVDNSSGGTSNQGATGSLTGQLEVGEGADEASIASANIAFANHPGVVGKSAADGSYSIPNAPTGTLEVYITSQEQNPTALVETAKYGVKLTDIVVKPNQSTDAGTSKMKPTGSLTGIVDFFENPNNVDKTGTDVFVPGTFFIAKTDSNGKFTLPGLPEGKYKLRLQRDGFANSEIQDIRITAGQTKDLGTLYLSIAKGPQGGISIDTTSTATISGTSYPLSSSKTVKAKISFDSDAVLMKVSDESSFLNKSWETVATSKEWTFTSDGKKTLYIMFSDLNGLESSPFSVDFYVDSEAPSVTSVKILHGWDQIYSSATKMPVTIATSDTGTGIEKMMFSSDSSFSSNTGWLDYATSYDNLSVSTTIYAKVRDFAGNESTAVSDTINTGSHSIIASGTYSDDFTLAKAQSPFRYAGNVTFSNLTIEAGVALDHFSSSSEFTFTVNGKLTAQGTSGSPITITSSSSVGFGGFVLSSSTSDANLIEYFTMSSLAPSSTPFITIDGGTVKNVTYTPSSGGAPFLSKTGFKTLSVQSNTITCSTCRSYAIKINGGSNAVTVTDNQFAQYGIGVWIAGGTGTSVTYNTFGDMKSTSGAMTDSAYVAKIDAGSATVSYNHVNVTAFDGNSTAISTGVAISGGGTATVSYNNFTLFHGSDTSKIQHLTSSSSTVNADYNYYAGHSTTNPNNSGATINVTNTQGSAWTTSAGTNCVGHQCS